MVQGTRLEDLCRQFKLLFCDAWSSFEKDQFKMKYKYSGRRKFFLLEYTQSIQQLQLRAKPDRGKKRWVLFRELGLLGKIEKKDFSIVLHTNLGK